MKRMISILALALFSSASFAGTVYIDESEIASLPDCGGTVQTKSNGSNSKIVVHFRNVVNCSNFDILKANGSSVKYPNQKLDGENRARRGEFTIPTDLIDRGNNTLRLVIQSNSKKTSDTIVVKFRQQSGSAGESGTKSRFTVRPDDYKRLESCGGSLEVNTKGGQLNLVFSDVRYCSNFDILKANGDVVDYKIQKLDASDKQYGPWFGSRTIPSRFIDWGRNEVIVVVKSNSGKTSETITVKFSSRPFWAF
jgi:hypothetical protein